MKTVNFSGDDAQDYYTINKQAIIVGGGFNVTQITSNTELNN